MEALKALKDKLKAEKEALASSKDGTGSKYTTKAELEAFRIKRLRDEEDEDRRRKESKRQSHGPSSTASEPHAPTKQATDEANKINQILKLSKQEAIRRLRALGQPATLFGEEDYDRLQRLARAEKEMKVEDEALGGGQQENSMLELQRAGMGGPGGGGRGGGRGEEAKRPTQALPSGPGAGAGAGGGGAGASSLEGPSNPATASGERLEAVAGSSNLLILTEAEDPTLAAFKRAAQLLADKRLEETLVVEDRIGKWIKKWMSEWEEDLERRPEEVKESGSGHQTTLTFLQTQKYFEILYERIKHRVLHEEIKTGLWMMISAMHERNYLHANDIYLRLAIGNSPWPIGVTSVGIHERSAREKISHVMNTSGMAHVMNDEATRKFFQAFKRLITFVQRQYPTDPSRSANFSTGSDLGRGVTGGGSDKTALLEAEANGELPLALEQAPHYVEKDGSIKVPTKWKYLLARGQEALPVPRANVDSLVEK